MNKLFGKVEKVPQRMVTLRLAAEDHSRAHECVKLLKVQRGRYVSLEEFIRELLGPAMAAVDGGPPSVVCGLRSPNPPK